MNQLLTDFLRTLARTTRFQFLPEDAQTAKEPTRALWLFVLLRAILGLLYFLVAAVLHLLFRLPVAAILLAEVAILALHHWLTAGREANLPRLFQQAWLAGDTPPEETTAITLFCQSLPALLLLALLALRAHIWLPAILALGAAAGRDLARRNPGTPLRLDWKAWLVAFATLFLTLVCPALGNAALRPLAVRYALLVFALALLLTPWLRFLPKRPAGLLPNTFLAETIVIGIVLILLCI